jgi:hypothetical protein
MEHATMQANVSRTQREMLERAKLMRVINDELNPPQASALVLNGFDTHESAEQAQGPARCVKPPTSTASAQTPRSHMTGFGQPRRGGSGRASNERSQIAKKEDSEFMANLSSLKRAQEALRLASMAVNRQRKVAKQELKKKKMLGDLYVPPESRSCSPVKCRGRRNRSDNSSSSGSESEDKEMPDN